LTNWKEIVIKPNDTLEHAIKVLHEGGARITLVADKNNKLLGTITDGDIRRALINKLTMKSEVKIVMNNNPIKAGVDFSKKKLLQLMTNKGLIHMPIISSEGTIIGLETIEHLTKSSFYKNPIFLMAGGFGKRLHPLTKDTPKPLLKIGGRPIIETIIRQFIDHGFCEFYISTHYKSEQIKDYFKDGSQYGVNIHYVHEDTPLGTAGSLGLLPKDISDLPMIVMNGDLLTKVDFEDLLNFHNDSDSDATMCIREYDVQVPFGEVEINEGKVGSIKEKPLHKFFVNAGIYVLNNNVIKKIDGKTYLDMPDFLENELNNNGINAFPIHEYWQDIGRIEEYTKANHDISLFNK
jgi:dTDP-glucose pyrophosphorylase/predicted transcriptional regulator